MKLYLVSASKNKEVTRSLLERIAEALEQQQYAHVAPFWQAAGIPVGVIGDISELPKGDDASPLVVYDTPDQAGFLGWHTYNSDSGRIHGTAFLDPILENGGTLIEGPNSLAATLSHEAIEATVNPYVNSYVFQSESIIEALEACDRVEGDSYDIDGVSVSNFLGPRAFRDGPGPFDWLRKLSGPWDLSPGGYVERTNVKEGQSFTVWGDLMPEWKRQLKRDKRARLLSRLANAPMKRPAQGV